MSISIKNITISIDGTLSKKFKIDIDGATYNLDKFKLTQRLLMPNLLTFDMHKNRGGHQRATIHRMQFYHWHPNHLEYSDRFNRT